MPTLLCIFQELLSKKDFPADVEGSRRLIEEHTQLKKKVGAAAKIVTPWFVFHIFCSPHTPPPSSVGAESSSGGTGPRRPETTTVHTIE